MITYITNIQVKSDKKIIGSIIQTKDGYTYKPKGSKIHGEVFKTIQLVKKSIEAE